jgi:glycosyltransferase involved in cell wall biosynthesis
MRIGFDLTVQEQNPAGVARLQSSLLEGLSLVDADHEYFLYSRVRVRLPVALGPRFKGVVAGEGVSPRRFRARVLPPLLKEHSIDIFHSPVVAIPFRGPGVRIATAHDIPWLHPQTVKEGGALRKTFAIGRTMRRAARVIVPSHATASDLARIATRHEDKIVVVRPGLPRRFLAHRRDESATIALRAELGLPDRPYLLAVGTVRYRKNLDLLFRLMAHLQAGSDAEAVPPLAIAGASLDSRKSLEIWAGEHGLERGIHFTGFVPEEKLIPLLDGALCLLFPTLLEGFGFPPLEAFARRIPVVAAPSGAVPEILGPQSALLVPPNDLEGWLSAVRSVLTEPELRERLVREGLKRVRDYDVEAAARSVLEVYDEVGPRPEPIEKRG